MDILTVLPHFSTQPFANLLPSLERHHITVSDILSSNSDQLAKRAQVPPREVRRLADVLLGALQAQYGLSPDGELEHEECIAPLLTASGQDLVDRWQVVSTLDSGLDQALGGGVPAGYVTEVTGESGAGKTQFLLTLLLAVQLPPPQGLSRSAIYISTESPLPTTRLTQLLDNHPALSTVSNATRPNLSRILTLQTPDLESQDHIIRYQLPVAIRRHSVGLVVIDSITANYRAEFEGPRAGSTSAGAAMAKRTAQLTEMGALLRELARSGDVAVVVANQVADRFRSDGHAEFDAARRATRWLGSGNGTPTGSRPQTPVNVLPSASAPPLAKDPVPPAPSASQPPFITSRIHSEAQKNTLPAHQQNPLTLDHQQRFFTGWGDDFHSNNSDIPQKTPSLGLVWTNQIACRIALLKHFYYSAGTDVTTERSSRRKRIFKVVFAPWAPGGTEVEFEVAGQGLKSVKKDVGSIEEGAAEGGATSTREEG